MECDVARNLSAVSSLHPFKAELEKMDYIMSSKNTTFNFSLSEAVSIIENYMKDDVFEGTRKIAILSGYVILIVTGVCTNFLISVVIICNSRLRVSRNLLIVNLSLSDLMLCLFCMPFTLVELLNRSWILGPSLCRGVPFIQGVTVFVSSATVSAIAIDRQNVIVNSSNSKTVIRNGKNRMLMYTSILWCLSVLLSLPIIFSKRIQPVVVADMFLYEKCIEQWPSTHARSMYTVLILFAQFFIPSVVLTVTHLRIKSYLNRSVRKHDAKSSPRTSERLKKELKRNNRATVVLSFISVVFACSWLPWNILNLMADFGIWPKNMPADHFSLAFALCHLLAMSSSVTNPILYGWFNSNIKRELRQIRLVAVRNVLGPKAVTRMKVNGSAHCENTYIRSSPEIDLKESQL